MLDEFLLTAFVLGTSISFGLFLALFFLLFLYAGIKRLITAVQNAIYYLLNGR